MKKQIVTENAPSAIGPYSQGISCGDLIFVSGQLGLDPASGEFAPGGVEGQARQSLSNLRSILEAAGSGMDKVVKTTVFLKDIRDFAAVNTIYAEFFEGTVFPARSAVQVAALPKDGLVEIEAIAAK
ncbi:MAG: RidA family protein [Oscillospiraceae bacterium]|nr:RidA family protein [Oscillospiraceae bacterium]